jgi:hypothetical protein
VLRCVAKKLRKPLNSSGSLWCGGISDCSGNSYTGVACLHLAQGKSNFVSE